ncbi:MAG: ammonia-forming cytochrome c nitrite reductase subunit c552 [Nitrospiraceae bacterium]
MRWDFVSSENSTGFHSPRESARILAESIDFARQAELKAWQVKSQLASRVTVHRANRDAASVHRKRGC